MAIGQTLPPPAVVFVNRFYAPDLSATSQMLGGIATGLAAAGFDITVVTSRQRYDDAAARLPRRESIAGVNVVRVWSTRFGRDQLLGRAVDYLSFYASTFFTLLWLLRRNSIVVAKTDPPLVSLVCAPAAWLRGAKLVNWLQDVFPEVAEVLGSGKWPRWLMHLLKVLRDATCRAAVANVVLGERMRERLVAQGLPAPRFTIIPNWADDRQIVPTPTSEARLRGELGWAGHFVVAYCGNLGRAHDYETLLEAAQLLRDDARLGFLVAGGGAGMVRLQAAVKERGLQAFRFLPYQPEAGLSDLLASADVHLVCLKPELEGLIVPSKLYGILAASRPALCWGDVDGETARELGRTGAGMAVAAGDAAGLAHAIRALQSSPNLRFDLGRRAREAFVARYTVGQSVAAWRRLLLAIT